MALPILILAALLSVFGRPADSMNAPPALSVAPTSGDIGGGLPTLSPPVDDIGGGLPTH